MRPPLRLSQQYEYADMLAAYLDCRRRKRTTDSAVDFEILFEENLWELLDEVNSGTYEIGPSRVFVVLHPKAREVWAAGFRDRIVHHLLYRDIGAWYEAGFIEDTFSCIKFRGTGAAIKRAEQHARRVTAGWTRPAWCLQMDIANFFVSINQQILWDVLVPDLGNSSLTARLLKQIVFHDCTVNARVSTPHLSHLVPRHKSLWWCPKGNGLPIGNLTSQFLSNVYLDEMDKFIKHVLRVKYYARYVDDLVLFSTDRDELEDWAVRINAWAMQHRALFFHENKISIKPADSGINFVGAVILPWRTYPRRTTVGSAKAAARNADMESVNSYMGILRQTDSFYVRTMLCEMAESALPFVHSDNEKTKIFYC